MSVNSVGNTMTTDFSDFSLKRKRKQDLFHSFICSGDGKRVGVGYSLSPVREIPRSAKVRIDKIILQRPVLFSREVELGVSNENIRRN